MIAVDAIQTDRHHCQRSTRGWTTATRITQVAASRIGQGSGATPASSRNRRGPADAPREVVENEQDRDPQEGEKGHLVRLNPVVEDRRGRRSISRSDEGEEAQNRQMRRRQTRRQTAHTINFRGISATTPKGAIGYGSVNGVRRRRRACRGIGIAAGVAVGGRGVESHGSTASHGSSAASGSRR